MSLRGDAGHIASEKPFHYPITCPTCDGEGAEFFAHGPYESPEWHDCRERENNRVIYKRAAEMTQAERHQTSVELLEALEGYAEEIVEIQARLFELAQARGDTDANTAN